MWNSRPRLFLHRLKTCATESEFLVFSTRFCYKLSDLAKELVGSAHPTFGARRALYTNSRGRLFHIFFFAPFAPLREIFIRFGRNIIWLRPKGRDVPPILFMLCGWAAGP
jgi:hypothetical protein